MRVCARRYDLIMPAILIRIPLDRTRFRFRSGFIGSISNEFDDRSFSREGKIAVVAYSRKD